MTPLALAALVALCGAIAACGRTEIVGSGRTLHLALTEYRLNPQRTEVRTGRLTIVVRNNGLYTHNLAVTEGSRTIGATPSIAPGHRARLTLTLRRGNYLMASTMLSDRDLGLYGTLIAK